MTRALILKELRHHWLPTLLIAMLLSIGFLLILGVVLQDESGSRFEAVRRFLMALLPLGALVLCNRLVVLEYQSKTQLFLESLPLPRTRMIAVKHLLGLALIFSAVGLAFALTIAISPRHEPITGRFLGIMAARGFTYSWCLYSALFAAGLTGRYRVTVYLIAIFGLFALDTMTQVELARFGPFALIDAQFAFERAVFPRQALLVSLGIGLCLMLLTLALSLVREGTVAALLAERMTHRQKVVVTVLILAIALSISIYDQRVEKKPFDLPDAAVAERGEVRVKVLADWGDGDAGAIRLAQRIADEVAAMQQYLGQRRPPPIFVTQRRELDAYHFERGQLKDAEGLLVRANFGCDDWDDGRFLDWLFRELLAVWSKRRLEREPNLWVLDGFSLSWSCRDAATAPGDRKQLELRAAYGAQQGFATRDAEEWLRYRERVGDDIAAAVAWRGIETLRREQGEARCRGFLQVALECGVPADLRGVFYEWAHPLPDILEREGGIAYSDFVAEWSGDLGRLTRLYQAELAGIPRFRGEVRFDRISDSTRAARFRFQSRPAPESGRFAVLYAELPPFAVEVEPSEIRREDALYPEQKTGELAGTFRRAGRFYSTFAVRVDQLGCEIITGWPRREIR